MKRELKPCPFCGNDKVIFEDVGEEGAFEDWGITCEECGAFFIHSNEGCVSTKEEVAVTWNKRINLKSDKTTVHLPIPCANVEEKTVKDWFQKINEELDELKEAVWETFDMRGEACQKTTAECLEIIAEEAADTITTIVSMLEAMGIDENMRQAAQKRVNKKNKEHGRF